LKGVLEVNLDLESLQLIAKVIDFAKVVNLECAKRVQKALIC